MNTVFSFPVRGYLIMTTIFFVGIIFSGGKLYLLAFDNANQEAVYLTCLITGATFLAGILSVSLLAIHKKQSIVYLNSSEKTAAENQMSSEASDLIDIKKIEMGIRSSNEKGQFLINELCDQLQAGQGAVYILSDENMELRYGYALVRENGSPIAYAPGEGLVGKVASERRPLYIDKVPEGYITVFSGLGAASPSHLILIPVLENENTIAVLEVATFSPIGKSTIDILLASNEIFASAFHHRSK